MHKLKIEAVLNEEIDAEGVGHPKSVTITGAGTILAPSALTDIAQEVVDSYCGNEKNPYLAMKPEWEDRADPLVIEVERLY